MPPILSFLIHTVLHHHRTNHICCCGFPTETSINPSETMNPNKTFLDQAVPVTGRNPAETMPCCEGRELAQSVWKAVVTGCLVAQTALDHRSRRLCSNPGKLLAWTHRNKSQQFHQHTWMQRLCSSAENYSIKHNCVIEELSVTV